MTDTLQRSDIERIIRSTGCDPEAYAWRARLKDHPTDRAVPSDCECDETGVQPLVSSLTNKNNVTNGYTPVAAPLADVSHVIPADAIELTEGSNAPASSLATPDTWLSNDDVTPGAENDVDADVEASSHRPVLPTPYYLKVDVFDNGTGKPG